MKKYKLLLQIMAKKMNMKLYSRILVSLLCVMQGIAVAAVSLPNGQYHESIDDLKVKVLGGYVIASRTWYQGKWHHTRAWNKLELEFDSADGSLRFASRNNSSFLSGSSGSFTNSIRINQTIEKKEAEEGYRWFDKKGNWIDYDGEGDIVKYGDKNNVEVSFIYNAEKQRIGVKDHYGVQRLWYEYNTEGLLASVRDHADPALARKVTYNYNDSLLTEVIDVRGHSWKYQYELVYESSDATPTFTTVNSTSSSGTSSGSVSAAALKGEAHLVRITDPEGRPTNIKYLRSGRTENVTKADGTGVFYKYDYDKTKKEYYTQQKYSSGRINEKWYDKKGEVVRRDINGTTVETITFNGRNRIHKNELGFETTREYDEFKNLTKIIHPDKSFRSYRYNYQYSVVTEATNELGVKTKYDYDANGNLTQVTEALGLDEQRITTYAYNEFGYQTEVKRLADAATEEAKTTYTYDSLTTKMGNRLTKTVSVSATENHVTEILSYDNMGNALQWKDPRGKIWNAEFDAKGQFKKLTTPISQVYLFGYDNAGYQKSYTDPKLNTEVREIDINGRLKSITDLTGGIMSWSYDAKGNLAEKVDPEGKKVQSIFATDGKLSQIIDGNKNIIQLTFGDAASKALNHQISHTQYPTFKRQYKYNNRAQVSEVGDFLSETEQHVSQIHYDAIGRVDYVIDAEQNKKQFTYDALNRPSTAIDAKNQVSKFNYDNRDNLISVTNEADIVIRKFEYDRKDRKTKEIWPLGETFISSYDANDNLIEKIDGKSQVTKLYYDDVNRLYKTEYYLNQTATAPVKTVGFGYNDLDQLTDYNDGTTSALYTYDAMYRKLTESVNYGTFNKGFSYSYYKNGLKKTFTDSESVTYGYTYDANNQVQSINITGLGQITYNSYNWFAPEKITYPGGITRQISYNPLMRTKRILAQDSAQNPIMDYQYTYDKVGNVNTKTTGYGMHTYGYDELYRLTSATNPGQASETYTYDLTGNRKTSTTTTGDWAYNSNNQLKSYTGNSFLYDNNGATTNKIESGVSTDYVNNLENRLSEIKQGTSSIASYYYDPFGRRLSKTVGGSTEYFSYTDEGLNSEYTSTGSVKQSYGFMPNSVWSTKPIYTKTSQGYSLYQNDALHTPQKITNIPGKVVWGAQYSSFGKATVSTSDVSNNLRFPGQYSDSESGLNNNYFRYYNNNTGRYMKSDPYGIYAGMNSYIYAGQNPLMFYDPLGLFSVSDPASWPSFPQGVVDVTAGFGDGMTGGITKSIRSLVPGGNSAIDKCSSLYLGSNTAGAVYSLGLGAGRLAYAGLAKGYSKIAPSGAAASAFRTKLRVAFGGGKSLRPPNLSKYPNDSALKAAAGRTNTGYNILGAGAGAAGAASLLSGDECGCD